MKELLGNAVHSPIEDKDLRGYSISRALLAAAGDLGSCLERDVHDEEVRRWGKERTAGFYISLDALGRAAEPGQQRAYPLDSATATEGAELKFRRPGDFIHALRPVSALARLGAQILQLPGGPVDFPKASVGVPLSWMATEESTATDSMMTLDKVSLNPRHAVSTTGFSRNLLRAGTPEVDAIVRADLFRAFGVGLDMAAIQGTGTSGQPSGVYVISGTQVHDCGPGAGAAALPDLTDATTMAGLVGDAEAEGELAFLTTPLIAASLKRTPSFSGGSVPLYEGSFREGRLAGFRATASNIAGKTLNNGAPTGGSEHGFICAQWAQCVIGLFGLTVIVDPYSAKKSQRIEVTLQALADITFRHASLFCVGTNAVP